MDLKKRKKDPLERLAEIPGARKAAPRSVVRPALATLASAPPEGDGWLHEIKYDGYRLLSHVRNGKAFLFTRHGKDWTEKFPQIAGALESLPAREAWLDGEAVFIGRDGRPSFEGLQKALTERRDGELRYIVFDIIFMDGYDLGRARLIERKEILKRLFAEIKAGRILNYGDYVAGKGKEFFASACGLSLEGIVSKDADSPYTGGRSRSWIKVKCRKRQEFVIGGYTESGGRGRIGALLVGVFDKGRLIYSGRVGTGFTEESMATLHAALIGLEKKAPSFHGIPAVLRDAHWVRPVLVAEVEFSEWTRQGILRQASFQGLRSDKPATEIFRESPAAIEDILREKISRESVNKKSPPPARRPSNLPIPAAFFILKKG